MEDGITILTISQSQSPFKKFGQIKGIQTHMLDDIEFAYYIPNGRSS